MREEHMRTIQESIATGGDVASASGKTASVVSKARAVNGSKTQPASGSNTRAANSAGTPPISGGKTQAAITGRVRAISDTGRHGTPLQSYNVFSAQCPSRRMLNDVTRRWSVLILATLRRCPQRFNELGTAIQGISERMLSITLKTLENDGLVSRGEAGEHGQPSTQYALTPSGATIASCLDTLFASIYSALEQQNSPDNSRSDGNRISNGRSDNSSATAQRAAAQTATTQTRK